MKSPRNTLAGNQAVVQAAQKRQEQVISPEQRSRMGPWVRELLGPAKAAIWWETPNPMLGGVKPYQMVLMGREGTLYRFIKESHEHGDTLQSNQRGCTDADVS